MSTSNVSNSRTRSLCFVESSEKLHAFVDRSLRVVSMICKLCYPTSEGVYNYLEEIVPVSPLQEFRRECIEVCALRTKIDTPGICLQSVTYSIREYGRLLYIERVSWYISKKFSECWTKMPFIFLPNGEQLRQPI